MDENPYQSAFLGLTTTDVTVLKSLVPPTVRSCLTNHLSEADQPGQGKGYVVPRTRRAGARRGLGSLGGAVPSG